MSEVESSSDESQSADLTSTPSTQSNSDTRERFDAPARQVPVREGLPPTYQMRAERHYVDFLADRSPAPREQTLDTNAIEVIEIGRAHV